MIAMPRKSAKKLKGRGNGFKNLRPRRQMKARKAGPTDGHRRRMGMSENLAEHYALPIPQEVEDEITEQRSIVTAHVQSGVS
jgi:hypothetical protein